MFARLKNLLTRQHEAPQAPPAAAPSPSPASQPARPDESAVLKSRGDNFLDENRFGEAAGCYRLAIAANPGFAEAYDNLGIALWQLKQYEEAEHCLKQAIRLKPGMAYTHYNLGSLLHEQGKLNDALQSFGRALEIMPYFAEAHHYMGVVLKDLNRAAEAEACFLMARAQMVNQLQHLCAWDSLEADIQFVRQSVFKARPDEKNLMRPFAFMSLPGVTAEEQKRYAEIYAQVKYQPFSALRPNLGFDFRRAPGEKIRVGYLSSDFHDHATARLMVEVFELHDRNRFHITAYSHGMNDGSPMRMRLEQAFDGFVDIQNDSPEQAARKIYDNQTDILVDLKGYTQGNRLEILALRPAPIQVNYLGYPGTLGADFVDYIIADGFIIPPEHEQYYSEKVVRLPDCYQPNDRSRQRPPAPSRSEYGLPERGFVFCCFNQTYKITPEVFGTWCRLLLAVPESCLWLWMSNPDAAANLKREAASRGIDPGRLVMAPTVGEEKHLARLQCADLFLDTLPVNAHTTCSDALWMGLPVVTCAGATFPSRVAGSLLTAMGVPELITYNLEDYFRLALDLATDKHKLDSVRRKITANRDTSTLFDCGRFTRNLEQAFEKMLQDAGRLPPARQNRSPA